MIFDSDSCDEIVKKIFIKKNELQAQGKKPRLVLVNEDIFKKLETSWIKAISELPWGDSLKYELEMRREQRGKIFLGDGCIFDLWVVKVDTIEDFQVF